MAIILPRGLPATVQLRVDGIEVADDQPATLGAKPRRPLTVVLLNLMPDKPSVEVEFARLLAAGPRDVRLMLAVPDGYETSSTDTAHMRRFYRPFFDLPLARIDAVIVTGAPVETVAFEAVRYWPGIARILDWLEAARVPAMHVCWAAQAALHHYHGVRKHLLPRKRFGLYPHVPVGGGHPLLAGVDLPFFMPVSRHTETQIADLARRPGLKPVLVAPVAGIGLVQDRVRPAVYCLNHPEYGPRRLHDEFLRDRRAGRWIDPPVGYSATSPVPQVSWHTAASAFYRNWLSEVAAADPRSSADIALDCLMRAEVSGMTRSAGGGRHH